MSSVQLYPDVIDGSSLGALFSEVPYLVIGIEGEMMSDGTAEVATPKTITRPSEAEDYFGDTSTLTALIKFVLGRGVPSVVAVASGVSVTAEAVPTLEQRKTAWATLEDDRNVRIRLTDSVTQADLVALADSCEFAEGINHKQFAVVGMDSGTSKATLISAVTAIASKRAVLVGPGVYDSDGDLLSGEYAAAAVAAEVSKNPDIADDLDTLALPSLIGIEQAANGLPVFRVKSNAGSPTNDFEDLLQAGVSPLRQAKNGGVEITHLRMAYISDDTYDSLMTRLIVDQVFIDVRNYCEDNKFLRRGNTAKTRDDLKAGVAALLFERRNWVAQITQSDGTPGYNVAVTASSDERQVVVTYSGRVVRGISTILIDARLQITV
jgi:hypothetical protein